MSDTITRLTERRASAVSNVQMLTTRALDEHRDLTPIECDKFNGLNTEIESIDQRLADLGASTQRRADTEAAFDRIARRPITQPGHRGEPLAPEDDEYRRAFVSAIKAKNPSPIEIYAEHPRTYYQPGVERRDLLKTTATQALRVSVWDSVVQHMVDSSALIAEGASITESDPTLAVSTLRSYKFGGFFQVSSELVNDSGTDLLGFLARQAGESLALSFGSYLITGTGTGQPQGIVTAAATGKTGPTGTATSLGSQSTAGQGTDVLYDLIASVAEGYARQPSTGFILNNASLAIARKLKDTQGQPVVGMTGGLVNSAVGAAPNGNQILGYPTFVDANVANMAANAKSIIFGDLSRYFVRIVNGIRFERSDEFAFQSDVVSFRCIIRLDGALVDANGLKIFQNSAT